MTVNNSYDGLRVVEHVINPGQTLTAIAAIYRLARWEPIVAYNTQVARLLDVPNSSAFPPGGAF